MRINTNRQLVGQFYNEHQKRDAVRKYFDLTIEDKIIKAVRAGTPTEAYGIALKLINDVFSSMKKDFEPPKPKKVVNENK
jgi:hypothetical protein